jgi:hypothetical protein
MVFFFSFQANFEWLNVLQSAGVVEMQVYNYLDGILPGFAYCVTHKQLGII